MWCLGWFLGEAVSDLPPWVPGWWVSNLGAPPVELRCVKILLNWPTGVFFSFTDRMWLLTNVFGEGFFGLWLPRKKVLPKRVRLAKGLYKGMIFAGWSHSPQQANLPKILGITEFVSWSFGWVSVWVCLALRIIELRGDNFLYKMMGTGATGWLSTGQSYTMHRSCGV